METGKVTQCEIAFEDHGILTLFVTFDLGSASQGLPCRRFGKDSEGLGKYVGDLMTFFSVDRLSKIPGKVCVIESDGLIRRLKHLPHETPATFEV